MTRIRKARKAKGWTQVDFSRELNTHPTNASRLETGKTKAGQGMMARVSAALGLPKFELFDRNGWPLDSEVAGVSA